MPVSEVISPTKQNTFSFFFFFLIEIATPKAIGICPLTIAEENTLCLEKFNEIDFYNRIKKYIKMKNNVLTWKSSADLESGLAYFIVQRNGATIGTVPKDPKNRFGRPLFQGLQYSDTPAAPLVAMQFTDTTAKPNTKYTYQVIAVNTAGLKSR